MFSMCLCDSVSMLIFPCMSHATSGFHFVLWYAGRVLISHCCFVFWWEAMHCNTQHCLIYVRTSNFGSSLSCSTILVSAIIFTLAACTRSVLRSTWLSPISIWLCLRTRTTPRSILVVRRGALSPWASSDAANPIRWHRWLQHRQHSRKKKKYCKANITKVVVNIKNKNKASKKATRRKLVVELNISH